MANIRQIRDHVVQLCWKAKKARRNTESALDVQDLERAEKSAREASDNAFKALQEAQSLTEGQSKTDEGKAIKELADQAQKNAMAAHHLIDVRKRSIRLLENSRNINTFLKLMPIIGFAILFFYFIKIDYFPRGLSFSDSLLVIFLAIYYGLVYLILIGIPAATGFVLGDWMRRKKNGENPSKETLWLSVPYLLVWIFLVIGILLPLTVGLSYLNIVWAFLFLIFILAIFIFLGRYVSLALESRVIALLIVFISVFFAIILIESFVYPSILKSTIKKLNFSRENTTLILSESDYRLVRNLAAKENLPVLYGCEKDSTLVHNVDILWNNLGENIYIRLPESLEKGKPEFRMEVKHSDTKIIDRKIIDPKLASSETVLSEGCVTVHIPNLFDAGQSKMAEQKAKDAVQLIPGWINNLMNEENSSNQAKKYAIKKINVTGYADITPGRKGIDNQKLSEKRAEVFVKYLKKSYPINKEEIISSKGEGNKNASDECKKFTSKEDIDNCQGLDRGVTLEFQISMVINENAQAESK